MNEERLQFPRWQLPLQDLILEFDHEKLRGRISEVEGLIHDRLRQVTPEAGRGDSEYEALNDALSILRVIKRDRLGASC